MKLILTILFFIILMNTTGNCQTIDEIGTNPTTTRTKCTYGFTPGTSIRFDYWLLPNANNAIPINSQGAPAYSLVNNVILPVVWKNVEASSYPDSSILKVQYLGSDNAIHNATKQCGPFTLTFKSITFVGGTSRNIPCYSTGSITIAINNYLNTGSDYDKDEWITHHFEWTLPSGWQTTTGQTGTFVSGPSISVIPPASTSATSISVRAKANTQYSATSTLQITRNLADFTVGGPTEVRCYETNRFTAPASSTGVTYTWQLPAGWTGVSNANYIDVTAQGPSGSIVCTMTGCNQTKVSTPKAVTVDVVNPNTAISGPSIVCSSGADFIINNSIAGTTVQWNQSSNLTRVSPQGANPCTFAANTSNSEGWIGAQITGCGNIVTLPVVPIQTGINVNDFSFEVWNSAGQFITTQYGLDILCPNVTYDIYVVNNGACETTNYTWHIPSWWTQIDAGENWIKINTNSDPSGNVSVDAMNCCSDETNIITGDFAQANYCYILSFTPNPATNETTLEVLDTSGKNVNAAWDAEVYDQLQILKLKSDKAKKSNLKINTSTWKEGVYMVRAKIGEAVISGKLVVKH